MRGPVQGWGGVQSRCEHRVEVIVKIQKRRKKKVGVGSSLGMGGGRRIEVIVKMQEKKSEGEDLARVDVKEELKLKLG